MLDFIKYNYINDSYLKRNNNILKINEDFFKLLKDNSFPRFVKIENIEKLSYFNNQNIFLKNVIENILQIEKENEKTIEILKNSIV
jgi:hypothetical protein